MPTDVVAIFAQTYQCPACGRLLNASGGPGMPRPGDLTVCFRCQAYLTYTDDAGGVRLLSDLEWIALPKAERDDVTAMRDKMRAFWKRFPKGAGEGEGRA